MITVDLEPDEVRDVLVYIGKIVERWRLDEGDPLFRAHRKLDAALLAHEESPR